MSSSTNSNSNPALSASLKRGLKRHLSAIEQDEPLSLVNNNHNMTSKVIENKRRKLDESETTNNHNNAIMIDLSMLSDSDSDEPTNLSLRKSNPKKKKKDAKKSPKSKTNKTQAQTPRKFPVFKPQTGECQICRASNKQLVNISVRCNHESKFCVKCITRAIESNICSKGSNKFSCSDTNCQNVFEAQEYYPLLGTRNLEIVDGLLLRSELSKSIEFRWCKNKNGCGAGQLISNWKELQGYYACFSCEQQMCFQHEIRWHTGFSCAEFEVEMKANNRLATNAVLSAFSKQCPNSKCQNQIAKLEGCDVMKCCQFGVHGCQVNVEQFGECGHGGRQFCGQLFCWRCLGLIEIRGQKQNNNNANQVGRRIARGRYVRHCKKNCRYANI